MLLVEQVGVCPCLQCLSSISVCLVQQDGKDAVQKTEAGFGERVKDARSEKGWTQRQFAEKLHLDASAVSRIEQGNRAVRLGEAAVIARVLDADLDYLVYGPIDPHAQLRNHRRWADQEMHDMRSNAVSMVENYVEILALLDDNPDLFEQLQDGEIGSPPTSTDEYLDWCLSRMKRAFALPEDKRRVVVTDENRAVRLAALIDAVVDGVVSTTPLPEGGSKNMLDDHEIASRIRHPAFQGAILRALGETENADDPDA